MNKFKFVNNLKVNEIRNIGIVYFLWCFFFLGICGLYRFYLGKYFIGFIWFIIFGLFGIG